MTSRTRCGVDIGRFPHTEVIAWGQVLTDWGSYDPDATYEGIAFEGPEFAAADVVRGWRAGERTGADAVVRDQLFYVEIADTDLLVTSQRRPKDLARAMMADLVGKVVPGMDAFTVNLPSRCPAADSPAVTGLIGEVAYAGGHDDYGNAECEYTATDIGDNLRLTVRSHTRQYWDIDADLVSSLGGSLDPGDGPRPWFDVPPGLTSRIHNSPGSLTIRFKDPEKLAYLTAEVNRVEGRIKSSAFTDLALSWMAERRAELPRRRRVD